MQNLHGLRSFADNSPRLPPIACKNRPIHPKLPTSFSANAANARCYRVLDRRHVSLSLSASNYDPSCRRGRMAFMYSLLFIVSAFVYAAARLTRWHLAKFLVEPVQPLYLLFVQGSTLWRRYWYQWRFLTPWMRSRCRFSPVRWVPCGKRLLPLKFLQLGVFAAFYTISTPFVPSWNKSIICQGQTASLSGGWA